MDTDLDALKKQHSAALTFVESLPKGSAERAAAQKTADRIVEYINDWHESANPTPFA
jgi:hypothetical protein